jgi:acetyl esterase/lipase
MRSIDLVDEAARDLASAFPAFDPSRTRVSDLRAAVAATTSPDIRADEVLEMPGPAGAPNVRALLYRPSGHASGSPALLYLHGGGFIAGLPEIADADNRLLADETGAVVLAVAYRLAPETVFPGPLEDCYAALRWLYENAERLGVDSTRISVMGQSAGGGLAAALSLVARDRGIYPLRAQFLIYPALDPRTGSPDAPIDNPMTGEFLWTRAANVFAWSCLRGTTPVSPEQLGHFGPALAEDLAGLPPAFIAVGALDLFLEEDVAFGLRLARSGVPIDMHVYPGAVHRFDEFSGSLANDFRADLRAALARFL